MQIGFGLPVSGAWATPQSISRFATLAEANGYHSLWAFQRLLVGADQQLDPVYHSVLDPLVALGFAAATTGRVRLGVAIVNVPFVEPAYLAKQGVATRSGSSRAGHRRSSPRTPPAHRRRRTG